MTQPEALKTLLESVATGEISTTHALEKLKYLTFEPVEDEQHGQEWQYQYEVCSGQSLTNCRQVCVAKSQPQKQGTDTDSERESVAALHSRDSRYWAIGCRV